MKYKMMVDESFTDKLNETITYQPGDIIKTKVDENRKEDLVARKLAHVEEVIDITDKNKKEAEKKAAEAKKKAEEEAKKLAEEAAKKEQEAKDKSKEKDVESTNNSTDDKSTDSTTGDEK